MNAERATEVLLCYLIAGVWAVCLEQDGAASFILVHQAGILEVGDEGGLPLDPGISQRRHLFAVELLPLLPIKSLNGIRTMVNLPAPLNDQ